MDQLNLANTNFLQQLLCLDYREPSRLRSLYSNTAKPARILQVPKLVEFLLIYVINSNVKNIINLVFEKGTFNVLLVLIL